MTFAQRGDKTIPLFYEKVYLHTDRDAYLAGEDMWFKAYLVNAKNNQPINYSHNLYVELIGPALNISMRHVMTLEDGLSNGDFKLPDTLTAGNYRLRAYTNWMRNFGDAFVFEKTIAIVTGNANAGQALMAKKRAARKPLSAKRQLMHTADTSTTGPFVEFFPEGGSMINDLQSMVAVKAEDKYGRGIPISGDVIATSGRTVAKFTCDSLGFGWFNITPDETQSYHAVVNVNGDQKTFLIHDARNKGFNLSVNAANECLVADITCNRFALMNAAGSNLIIVAQHSGKTYYKEQLKITSNNILVQIPDVNLPEGVACITIFDEYAKPLCERLIYVNHIDAPTIKLVPDKSSYLPREKVSVKIEVSGKAQASLSLAAVDESVVPVQAENILSYLQLRSEIRGVIEHPERYFDTTNANRFAQLDLLLLTQGWRDFVWKDLGEKPIKPLYEPEQSITITGNVRKVWNKKLMPAMNITMFAPKAIGDKLFTAVSDSLGKFRIDGPVFYGYQFANFTSRSATGISDDGTSKGKTGGYIQVDSLFKDVLDVKPADNILMDTNTLNRKHLVEREEAKKKFTFAGMNTLKTVQIKSYTNVLPPDVYTIVQADQKLYGSLMQYLLYMIDGTHMEVGNGCHIRGVDHDQIPMVPILQYGFFEPLLHTIAIRGGYADKSPIDYHTVCDDDYLSQPMSNIFKVTINKFQTVYGIRYAVYVVLRPGCLQVKDIFDNTAANFTGYYQPRVFYSPKYDAPNAVPDYRTTIHWEPNITTDKNGEATVSFYNADPKSNIRVVVEGVTDKGMPVAATATYVVK